MDKNKPVKNRVIKRSTDVRGQIHAAWDKEEEQRDKSDEKTEKKLRELKKEILDEKRHNHQYHFLFATALISGAVAANFLGFRGDELEDFVGRAMAIAVTGG